MLLAQVGASAGTRAGGAKPSAREAAKSKGCGVECARPQRATRSAWCVRPCQGKRQRAASTLAPARARPAFAKLWAGPLFRRSPAFAKRARLGRASGGAAAHLLLGQLEVFVPAAGLGIGLAHGGRPREGPDSQPLRRGRECPLGLCLETLLQSRKAEACCCCWAASGELARSTNHSNRE